MPFTASDPPEWARASSRARDRFVLARRGSRPVHDPWRHQGVRVEDEPDGAGATVATATLFLTGRECPWRCAMCDLWRYTTAADTPAGAIPRQIADARTQLAADGPLPDRLKLYNAGSFFDPRAVPPEDDDEIARQCGGWRRVIVESHPALVGARTWRFQERLRRAGVADLEVAMGLETTHPAALEQLHKRTTVAQFADAASRLAAHAVRLRVFLLVSPPFIPAAEQDAWLARSVETALACGAGVVSLIPTRSGNGAMEAFAAAGDFAAPRLSDLERSLALGLRVAAGATAGGVVLADLWDLERLIDCVTCAEARRRRLTAMNLTQRDQPAVACGACGGSAA